MRNSTRIEIEAKADQIGKIVDKQSHDSTTATATAKKPSFPNTAIEQRTIQYSTIAADNGKINSYSIWLKYVI